MSRVSEANGIRVKWYSGTAGILAASVGWLQGTPDVSDASKGRVGFPTVHLALAADDSWTDEYFTKGHLKELDRLRFPGE
ncbi:MAG: hypothetical protein PVJ33_13260 [Lysobacterales bacterium]